MNVHAKETQVNTVDLFKGKEGFGSVWKGFCHLSTIYKPTQFRLERNHDIAFRSESSEVAVLSTREEKRKLLEPCFHSWFHFHSFVRSMNYPNSDFPGLGVILSPKKVIYTILQKGAKPGRWQPYK